MEETWIITDHFMRRWRAWIVPVEDRSPVEVTAPWEQPEDPLVHMIYYSFTDDWALCDEMASDLIDIYDALTGAALGEELPEPTQDPRRLLRGFKDELHDILYAAAGAGTLKFERIEVPWPFPEKDEKPPSKRQPQPSDENDTHDVLVHVPVTVDDAKNLPHVFLLESDDGSIRMKKALANQARSLGEFACELEFKDLKKSHQYRLSYQADGGTCVLFEYTPYDQVPHIPVPGAMEGDPGAIEKMFADMHAADDELDAAVAPSEPPPPDSSEAEDAGGDDAQEAKSEPPPPDSSRSDDAGGDDAQETKT